MKPRVFCFFYQIKSNAADYAMQLMEWMHPKFARNERRIFKKSGNHVVNSDIYASRFRAPPTGNGTGFIRPVRFGV